MYFVLITGSFITVLYLELEQFWLAVPKTTDLGNLSQIRLGILVTVKKDLHLTMAVTGGDGGFTAIDYNDPTRYYTSYTSTSINRVTAGGTVAILSSGQIGGYMRLGVFIEISGEGSFINPFIMDPRNATILYTCAESVWRSSNAAVSPVTWTEIGTKFL